MTITVTTDKQGTPKPRIWQRIRGRSIRVRVRFRMGRHTNYLQEIMANGWEWNQEEWEPTPKGSTIKLFGLTDFSCFWRFKRVKKGGWKHLLSADHETSDRVVAVWGEHGVTLRAYPYREGSGPSTNGVSYSETLCTVPVSKDDPAWTEWANVSLFVIDRKGQYMVYSPEFAGQLHENRSPRRTPLQWLSWSHGRNGDGGLSLPVQYEIEVL